MLSVMFTHTVLKLHIVYLSLSMLFLIRFPHSVFSPDSCDDGMRDLLLLRKIRMLHWLEPPHLDIPLDLENIQVSTPYGTHWVIRTPYQSCDNQDTLYSSHVTIRTPYIAVM